MAKIKKKINYKINPDVNWSEKCVLVAIDVANQEARFSITDTKLHISVVTL